MTRGVPPAKPDPPTPELPVEAEFVWSQDSDSMESGDLGQTLTVGVTDAGSGTYLWLKTGRWAMDADQIDGLAEKLRWALRQCKPGC